MKSFFSKFFAIAIVGLFSSSLHAGLIPIPNIAAAKNRIDGLVAQLQAEVATIENTYEKKLNELNIVAAADTDPVPNDLKVYLEMLSNKYAVGIEAEEVEF